MLSRNETETIRAALKYWRDEVAGHDDLARLYMTESDVEPIAAEAIESLIECFQRQNLRYVAARRGSGPAASLELLAEQKLPKATGASDFFTVILR